MTDTTHARFQNGLYARCHEIDGVSVADDVEVRNPVLVGYWVARRPEWAGMIWDAMEDELSDTAQAEKSIVNTGPER